MSNSKVLYKINIYLLNKKKFKQFVTPLIKKHDNPCRNRSYEVVTCFRYFSRGKQATTALYRERFVQTIKPLLYNMRKSESYLCHKLEDLCTYAVIDVIRNIGTISTIQTYLLQIEQKHSQVNEYQCGGQQPLVVSRVCFIFKTST